MHEIPLDLLRVNDGEYDVNVVIGENGSGKSILLDNIARAFIAEQKTVIAVATSVHDKFTVQSKNFHFYGGRQGRNMVSKIIKRSLVDDNKGETDRIKSLIRVIEYVGFDTRIGIKVDGFNPENIQSLGEPNRINDDIYDLISLLNKYKAMFIEGGIVSIDLRAFSHGNINSSALSAIVKYEQLMKKHKIIKDLSIYLQKNSAEIKLKDASSGELLIISTLIFIASIIDNNTVLLIDEPENSLHPKWQREYIEKILDVFYYQHPKIIVATHSPLFVSGTKANTESTKVYRANSESIVLIDRKAGNVEELLWYLFGMATPENRFMSNYFVSTLNSLARNEISKDEVFCRVETFSNNVYDRRQIEVLNGVKDIANKIAQSGSQR